MNSDSYILLCVTSDTVTGVGIGTFEEMSKLKEDSVSISDAIGVKLVLEGTPSDFSSSDITNTSRLIELYGHLMGLNKGVD